MKTTYKRLSLFIHLMLLFSIIKADETSYKNRFEFLKTPHESTALVEDRLKLAGNVGSVFISTLINTEIWLRVCEATGFISGVVSKHQFTGQKQQELQAVQANFCTQLAPLIATTETALVGKVSPWPLPPSWRTLFLGGVVLSAYGSYVHYRDIPIVTAAVMTYLTAEALSRTMASHASTEFIKKKGVTHVIDDDYRLEQYTVLDRITAILTSLIVHEALLYTGVSPIKAGFMSIISGIVVGMLSSMTSPENAGLSEDYASATLFSYGTLVPIGFGALVGVGALAEAEAEAGVGASVRAVAGAGVLALSGALAGGGAGVSALAEARVGDGEGIWASGRDRTKSFFVPLVLVGTGVGAISGAEIGAKAGTKAGAECGAMAGALAGALAGTLAGALAGALAESEVGARVLTLTETIAGVGVGVGVGIGSIIYTGMLAKHSLVLVSASAAATATVLTLINSMSGYTVYGYPLEQSLSETSQTLWKKFYAPMEYLSTLFQ
ncbi:hypothetical protein [Endozoicomonas euniceicola]|uniref:Uncharacterized protein n=1 Tax=Endozoicomonas euniceicola TaxID=1234143 RepID=A0ABY6GQN7_9GAMM|nr:hypothetical protein [Endozoicomonas euniceicola]UYM14882.1 hypothetical protein NX720_18600 [Endozoicomonas euniceicola]